MAEVLEQGADKGMLVLVFSATWGPDHSGKDVPMQINLGTPSPTLLQTDLPIFNVAKGDSTAFGLPDFAKLPSFISSKSSNHFF